VPALFLAAVRGEHSTCNMGDYGYRESWEVNKQTHLRMIISQLYLTHSRLTQTHSRPSSTFRTCCEFVLKCKCYVSGGGGAVSFSSVECSCHCLRLRHFCLCRPMLCLHFALSSTLTLGGLLILFSLIYLADQSIAAPPLQLQTSVRL
jgi:hypothetical protein